MASFHSNHCINIRLEDNGTVAHRVEGDRKGIVFTKQSISVGTMFEVKIIEEVQGQNLLHVGSLVSIPSSMTI